MRPICNEKLEEIIRDTLNGLVCEISFQCKTDGEMGYWAYGYYNPSCPYQG